MTAEAARVWAEIDTSAWRGNVRAISRAVAPAETMAVVKANAYGLGVRPAVLALREAGVRHLAVACLEEALEVADLGLSVLILGTSLPEEVPGIVAAGVAASVADLETARLLSRAAVAAGSPARVHVKIDTGMGRLGFLVREASRAVAEVASLPGLLLEGIYTHFPSADGRDGLAQEQVREFAGLIRRLAAKRIRFRWKHIANSAAVAGLPASYRAPFTMVRPGLELHGAQRAPRLRPYDTTPVLTLKSRLVAVRHLPAGSSVGYGCTWRVTAAAGERIGTVCVGYADGYPRSLSNRGVVLVRGHRCPVVGRVCMDYTMVSLADVPAAQPGDEVVLIGSQDGATVPITEVARAAKTIPYELMCGLGPRVKRRYLP